MTFDYIDDADARTTVRRLIDRWVRNGQSLSALYHAMQEAIDDDRDHNARRRAAALAAMARLDADNNLI